MASRSGCVARCYGGQMTCYRCGYTWDISDDEPPECKTDQQLSDEKIADGVKRGRAALTEIKEILNK